MLVQTLRDLHNINERARRLDMPLRSAVPGTLEENVCLFYALQLEVYVETACLTAGVELSQISPSSDQDLEELITAHMTRITMPGSLVEATRATMEKLIAEVHLPAIAVLQNKTTEAVHQITLNDLIAKLRQLLRADEEAQELSDLADTKDLPEKGFVLLGRLYVRGKAEVVSDTLGFSFSPGMSALLHDDDHDAASELEPLLHAAATICSAASARNPDIVAKAIMLYVQALIESAVSAVEKVKSLVPEAVATPTAV